MCSFLFSRTIWGHTSSSSEEQGTFFSNHRSVSFLSCSSFKTSSTPIVSSSALYIWYRMLKVGLFCVSKYVISKNRYTYSQRKSEGHKVHSVVLLLAKFINDSNTLLFVHHVYARNRCWHRPMKDCSVYLEWWRPSKTESNNVWINLPCVWAKWSFSLENVSKLPYLYRMAIVLIMAKRPNIALWWSKLVLPLEFLLYDEETSDSKISVDKSSTKIFPSALYFRRPSVIPWLCNCMVIALSSISPGKNNTLRPCCRRKSLQFRNRGSTT